MSTPLRIVQPTVHLADPHDCTDGADMLSILTALFDTLVRREGRCHVPHLAESWDISADCRTFDLCLRGGVTFADGTSVDAEAVCTNLRRMARPDKGYTLGSPGAWHQYLGGAEIRPTGMLTLRIDLAAPVADLLDVLCQAFVAAPACLDALDAGDLSAAIGSGPYRLDDVSAGSITASARRDHFAGTPAHPAIAWIALPDPQDRLVHLAEECAEIATRLPTDALPPEGAALVRYADPTAIIYLFNQATGPLVDARVRRALNMAIDRTTLIDDVLGGAARPLHGFVSDAHFGAATGTDDPHDPGEARRLLSEAGHGTGLTLTVDCPTRLPDEAEALTAALAGQLAPLGVTLDIRRHADREAYAHMVRRKEIGDMCVFDSSPMSTFRVLHEKLDSRVSGAWWQGHRNPALERHLDRARRIADPDEREAVYRDIYRMVQADPPWLFLYTATRVLGLRGHAPGFDMPADGVLDVARLPRLVPAPARGA